MVKETSTLDKSLKTLMFLWEYHPTYLEDNKMEIKEAHMRLIKENADLVFRVSELEQELIDINVIVRKEVLLDVAQKLGFVHTGVIE